MSNSKNMVKRAVLIVLAVLILGAAAAGGTYLIFRGGGVYYVRVDNTGVTENRSRGGAVDFTGGLPYLYTLQAFDGQGRERDVTFGTYRILREGAILRLNIVPLRGVVNWTEVQPEGLPAQVLERLEN